MRFYPNGDVNFYVEIPPRWSLYCREPAKKWAWRKLEPVHVINYWRDLEGARRREILQKDLYFQKWLTTRIREEACLPLYSCVGNRFIRLERAFPAGFKCAELPLNLEEARAVKAQLRNEAKARKAALKAAKKAKKGKKGK